ncbi:MAG: bifunctional diaminohydroxyphosphoribosylaminopyrimidine deaminase/5-amino-6-(5-phosphoribosylamino)uracil reductase RibD [Bacteroidia bacterium]|nr:bifunctional diaminohydroxyphosphoribosylaminopyrimidine deaminase/5-amino-6-(5-phosphoribosylamino)uracil reductase RibD [Bacteroidia bacterium]
MPSTESSRKTLYLIDGSAYIYRAFFALPALNNSQGLQTNAILGFTTTLLKIIRERKPDGLVVAFDEKGPTLRHEEFTAYKAQRPPMPEGMSAQIPYIHRVVDDLNIPAVRQAGYEADDLIGTLAHQAEQAGFDVVIVTGDKDMFQLLTPHVRIYDPVKDKWLGEVECVERFGVEPARVVEIMGLMGDAADNIPGVKGIGEKTAMKLIAQFNTIEELLRRVEEVAPPRIKALLVDQAENARLSRRLATIQLDSPVAFEPATYHLKPPHQDQLTDLLRELGFTTLLKSFQPSFSHAEANAVNSVLDKEVLKKSTVYVNLEPCSHDGKTPPCADLLIRHQIKCVVIANSDTNPLVAGNGIKKLMEAGIEVKLGVLKKEGAELNKRFFTFVEKKRPFIVLKWAQTDDGFIAHSNYESRWISSELSRQVVHKWRSEEDAVLVGTKTAAHDNPTLSVRDWSGRNPIRVVIDRFLRLPSNLNLFDKTQNTICYNVLKHEEHPNLKLIRLDEDDFINQLVQNLYKQKIQSIMVEGGAQTLKLFIESGLWDEARTFTSTRSFGEGIASPLLHGELISQESISSDLLKIYKHSDGKNKS